MKKIYVSFHIGRGGNYNNAGHLSYSGEEDFQDLITRFNDVCTIISHDEDGKPLAPEEWTLIDDASERVLIQGRDAIGSRLGKLEWDGEYDTDYVTTTDNLSDKELDALWNAHKEVYMSDDLIEEILGLMRERGNMKEKKHKMKFLRE